MNRFQDGNLILSSFEDEVFVACPKCEKRATVIRDDRKNYLSDKSIKCVNCGFSQTERKKSYQVELDCNCPNCAETISVCLKNVNEPKKSISVKCQKCGESNNFKPRNIELEWIYKNIGQPTEPHFQLPLWLTTSIKGNILWAYNYQHAQYLQDYISADLREKNGRAYWTMVEKLPTWMTSAKNRDDIVKGLDKLLKK